jgi:hypothetical protein
MPKLGDRRPSVDLRVEEKSVLTVAEMLEERSDDLGSGEEGEEEEWF